ncbi:MAG: hypothetical protein JWO82_827 [Akkermansiaceae bacterium]|nr:hypothetical protein [Akkermansiaceae bacterium]
MMFRSLVLVATAAVLSSSLGHAATVLATDFTGVDTSGSSATNISWTANGVQVPAATLTFYDPAAPATTFGFRTGGTPADNIQVARNIETAGPWATSFIVNPTVGLDLTGFALDFRAISNTAGTQSASKSVRYTLEIFDGTTSLGSAFADVTDPGGTAGGVTANLDLTALPDLNSGTAYTFVVTASSFATSGNNVAIDNLVLTGNAVPEPTSALLASAAAVLPLLRRRRQA